MNELLVKLNQKFKSFENDFQASLFGDLIILSGVNGSGKSQLLNIIYGQEGKDSQKKVQSLVHLNNEIINYNDIDYRSFKENANIPELTQSSSQNYISSSNQAWVAYTRNLLDPLSNDNYSTADSCLNAKKILIEKFGVDKFNNVRIAESEFKTTLNLANFIWKAGDKFTNSIGEIFFKHSLKVSEKMKDVGRANFIFQCWKLLLGQH